MSIFAAFDLGSNSLKVTVADVRADGFSVLFERQAITRIGEQLDTNGFLLASAMDRTLEELARLVTDARAHGAEVLKCVGTAGLRGASNAQEFLVRVRAQTGLEVEIIDGMREAELTFAAPAGQFGPGPVVVFDLGGRSTEIVVGQGTRIDARSSFEMGSVRLTERFLKQDPPSPQELESMRQHVRGVLADAPNASDGARLVGVSGTVISLFGLVRGIADVEEAITLAASERLGRAELEAEAERLLAIPASARVMGTVLPPLRADVIVAGAFLVLEILDHYRATELFVTHRGVRYGLLEEARAKHR